MLDCETMKTKSIFALMLGMLLVLGACSEEQEPNNDKGNQQNEQYEAPSSDQENEQNETPSSAVTGTLQGHDYVDLGLPKGTLWATCNVGAPFPGDYGDYFAWGETKPKSSYTWEAYKYGSYVIVSGGYTRIITKYCNNSENGENGFTDDKTVLDAEDDAAIFNWGDGWRMPTKDEFKELCNYCSSDWTIQDGKNGRLFTGPNGNTLFLPAAGRIVATGSVGAIRDEALLMFEGEDGYYWSSSLYDYDAEYAYRLRLYSDGNGLSKGFRSYAMSVRPVVK